MMWGCQVELIKGKKVVSFLPFTAILTLAEGTEVNLIGRWESNEKECKLQQLPCSCKPLPLLPRAREAHKVQKNDCMGE